MKQDLNLYTLQSFMDSCFPNKEKSPEEDKEQLLKELEVYGETLETLKRGYEITKEYISEIEKEVKIKVYKDESKKLHQDQFVRNVILDLTNNKYWELRKSSEWQQPLIDLKEKIRKEIAKKK
ncbi:MAG: hypothetical protein JSV96_15155 [Candidatus Aminicenantes bacterium]|nr:MAG: hypothetical protein JSV96_15155 [Candidatus Aminicenantes bacterium]